MLVGHFCIFFEEMSIQVVYPFFNQTFKKCWVVGILYIFWILTLFRYMICKFSHSLLLLFSCCVWLFCNSMDCSPLGFFIHGISQARILEWVTVSFSRGSSWPRDRTHTTCICRQILYHWATREALSFLHLSFFLTLLFVFKILGLRVI